MLSFIGFCVVAYILFHVALIALWVLCTILCMFFVDKADPRTAEEIELEDLKYENDSACRRGR